VQVNELAVVTKGLETVSETFGYQQCAVIGGGKLHGVPLQKGGRRGAKVHCHIPNCAAQTSYEFHLGIRGFLEMQAANRALFLRDCLIDLGDGFVPARGGEFVGAEEAREEAAAIAQLLALDNLKIGDGGIANSKSAHDAPLDSLAVS
jgi:hypothetical protein